MASQVSVKETSQVESLDDQLQIVSQVSRAAIRLIGELSGLTPYIYGSVSPPNLSCEYANFESGFTDIPSCRISSNAWKK